LVTQEFPVIVNSYLLAQFTSMWNRHALFVTQHANKTFPTRKAFDHLNTNSWLAWIPSHKSYGNSPFCHPHLPTPKQSWTSFLFFWEGGEVGFETLTADCRNQSLVGSPGYRGYVRIVNFRGLYKFDKGSFPFEHATFVHAVSRHILIGR